MKNFVIQYSFSDINGRDLFIDQVKKEFAHIKKESNEEFTYYLVASDNLPSVVYAANMAIQRIKNLNQLNDGDFVSIYFTDETEPDLLKRELAFGTENDLDNKVKSTYAPIQDRLIFNLLSYNFFRQHQE